MQLYCVFACGWYNFRCNSILILANKLLQPDFTKGAFLDILLKDEVTKKINNNIVKAATGTAIFQGLGLHHCFGSSSYILCNYGAGHVGQVYI